MQRLYSSQARQALNAFQEVLELPRDVSAEDFLRQKTKFLKLFNTYFNVTNNSELSSDTDFQLFLKQLIALLADKDSFRSIYKIENFIQYAVKYFNKLSEDIESNRDYLLFLRQLTTQVKQIIPVIKQHSVPANWLEKTARDLDIAAVKRLWSKPVYYDCQKEFTPQVWNEQSGEFEDGDKQYTPETLETSLSELYYKDFRYVTSPELLLLDYKRQVSLAKEAEDKTIHESKAAEYRRAKASRPTAPSTSQEGEKFDAYFDDLHATAAHQNAHGKAAEEDEWLDVTENAPYELDTAIRAKKVYEGLAARDINYALFDFAQHAKQYHEQSHGGILSAFGIHNKLTDQHFIVAPVQRDMRKELPISASKAVPALTPETLAQLIIDANQNDSTVLIPIAQYSENRRHFVFLAIYKEKNGYKSRLFDSHSGLIANATSEARIGETIRQASALLSKQENAVPLSPKLESIHYGNQPYSDSVNCGRFVIGGISTIINGDLDVTETPKASMKAAAKKTLTLERCLGAYEDIIDFRTHATVIYNPVIDVDKENYRLDIDPSKFDCENLFPKDSMTYPETAIELKPIKLTESVPPSRYGRFKNFLNAEVITPIWRPESKAEYLFWAFKIPETVTRLLVKSLAVASENASFKAESLGSSHWKSKLFYQGLSYSTKALSIIPFGLANEAVRSVASPISAYRERKDIHWTLGVASAASTVIFTPAAILGVGAIALPVTLAKFGLGATIATVGGKLSTSPLIPALGSALSPASAMCGAIATASVTFAGGVLAGAKKAVSSTANFAYRKAFGNGSIQSTNQFVATERAEQDSNRSTNGKAPAAETNGKKPVDPGIPTDKYNDVDAYPGDCEPAYETYANMYAHLKTERGGSSKDAPWVNNGEASRADAEGVKGQLQRPKKLCTGDKPGSEYDSSSMTDAASAVADTDNSAAPPYALSSLLKAQIKVRAKTEKADAGRQAFLSEQGTMTPDRAGSATAQYREVREAARKRAKSLGSAEKAARLGDEATTRDRSMTA